MVILAQEKAVKNEEDIDSNIISKDEFQDLEKKEGRGRKLGLFGKKAGPKKPIFPGPSSRGEVTVEDVLMRVEKIDARIEMFEGIRKATDERISALTEEIGELRSAILEKEKRSDEMESRFRKVIDISEEINPEKINKDLEKKDEDIVKMQSKVDNIDMKYEETRKNLKDMKTITENIKDIKKIFTVSSQLDKKMEEIEEEKKDISRMAGKTETMFTEINDKLRKFEKYREKIEFNEETIYELMKSVDAIEVRLDKFVKTEKLDEILQTIDELKKESQIKTDDLKDILDRLLTDLKKSGMKNLLRELGDERLKGLEKKLDSSDTDRLARMQAQLDANIKKLEPALRAMQSQAAAPSSAAQPVLRQSAQTPMTTQKYSYKPAETKAVPLPPNYSYRPVKPREDRELMSIPLPPKRAAPVPRPLPVEEEEEIGLEFDDEADEFEKDVVRSAKKPMAGDFEEDGDEEFEKLSKPRQQPPQPQTKPWMRAPERQAFDEQATTRQSFSSRPLGISETIENFSVEIASMIMQGRAEDAKRAYQRFLEFYEGAKSRMSLEDYSVVYRIMSQMNRVV